MISSQEARDHRRAHRAGLIGRRAARRNEALERQRGARPGGLDVHKAQMTACVRVPGEEGGRRQEVVEFRTTVGGLLVLRDWLKAHRVTQVAMEFRGSG